MSQTDDNAGAIERMLALKALPLFVDVHADELAIIAEHAEVRAFRGGETLFCSTEAPVTSIHLVLEGSVTEHRGGRPFRTHGAPYVVGGIDALALAGAEVAAIAAEDTRTLAIERTALRDILEDNFGILSATLQGVAAATLRLRRQLTSSAGFAEHAEEDKTPASLLNELGAKTLFLREHPWLRHAKIRTLSQLARDAELASLGDGEPLWAQGDPADHAVLVVRGVVGCATIDGRQHFEGGRDAIFGLEEALAMDSRWYGAVARGAVSFFRITRAAIVDALEDDPDTALAALAAIASVASLLRDQVARATDPAA